MSAAPPPTPTVPTPERPRWHGRLAARLIWLTAEAVASTVRFRYHDVSGLAANADAPPVIYCLWHNRLAFSMIIFRRYVQRRRPQRRLAALVSASRDGSIMARVLELFGVQPVRGSSSRRGPQALLELTTWAEQGYDLAITPDGPRGPCYEIQRGILGLARVTGRPVVPVSYHLNWKLRLRSWDRFLIPLPFALCDVYFGQPLPIPDGASEVERAELQARMMEITRD